MKPSAKQSMALLEVENDILEHSNDRDKVVLTPPPAKKAKSKFCEELKLVTTKLHRKSKMV